MITDSGHDVGRHDQHIVEGSGEITNGLVMYPPKESRCLGSILMQIELSRGLQPHEGCATCDWKLLPHVVRLQPQRTMSLVGAKLKTSAQLPRYEPRISSKWGFHIGRIPPSDWSNSKGIFNSC